MEIAKQMHNQIRESSLILSSSSSSGRNNGNFSTSPEFEFWMTRNPAGAQPELVAADELFVDGIIKPLDLLQRQEQPDPTNPSSDPPSRPGLGPGLSENEPPTVSKRWKDIFKKSTDRKSKNDEKDKKKREKKGNLVTTAELNINIWPFSRSRSAGNGGSRPRMAAPASRKISSAPCSRSNSAGESKSRKWPSSPSRGGVHIGRNSPVWQARRVSVAAGRSGSDTVTRNAGKGVINDANETRRSKPVTGAGGAKAKVLNVNVPTCIGYRSHLSCRSDEIEVNAVVGGGGNRGSAVDGGGGNISGDGGRGNSNLFNLRGLFTKKVY